MFLKLSLYFLYSFCSLFFASLFTFTYPLVGYLTFLKFYFDLSIVFLSEFSLYSFFSHCSRYYIIYTHNLIIIYWYCYFPVRIKHRNLISLSTCLPSFAYNCLKYFFYAHLESHQTML